MKKRYIIWKDPACNGRDVEWMEIDGRQFAEMMKRPENRHRRFLRLTGEPHGEADTLFIEATEEQYRAWKNEYEAARYRSDRDKGITVLSLDQPLSVKDGMALHDLIPDEHESVEEMALKSALTSQVLSWVNSLPEEDRKLLLAYYADGKTTVQLAREYGVSQQAISKRLGRLLSRLKKIF